MKKFAAVRLLALSVAVLVWVALAMPAAGSAATVVNGDFESGDLQGWQAHRATEAGNWFAYSETHDPIADKRGGQPIQEPPQGTYAAIADEIDPETLVLSQEVALAPGLEHRLSLLAYYDSFKPLAVPSPDTLSVSSEVLGGQANQQFRIDVMRPGSPIESIDPADILQTVFRTQSGDPQSMQPTRLAANLTPFAGQTVRLRIAVAAHEEWLAAGIDAVSIESAPPGQLKPGGKGGSGGGGSKGGGSGGGNSTALGFGKLKLNARNGTAVLPVRVPAAGKLTAKTKKRIKQASATAKGPATLKLHLIPTAAALAILREKHKLRVQLAVGFQPKAGAREATTVPVTLKLEAPKHARR
jgi:hypothetical protein